MSMQISISNAIGGGGGAQGGGTPSFQNLNSFSFDGIDDYFLGTSTYSEIDGLDNFAFSFWIKPSVLSGFRQIVTIGTNSADYRNQQIQIASTNGRIQVYVSSTSYYWNSTASLTQDVWQHILVTRDSARPINQKGKVYINGVDSSSSDNTRFWTNNASSNSGLMIGRHNNGWASLFSGKIDEVAVYTQDMASYVSEIYGGGEAVDLNNLATAPQPTTWSRMGDLATWNGATWTMTDVNGGYVHRSINMVEANRTTDVPPNPFVNTKSILLDGVDDYVDFGNTGILNGGAELTVSGWFKTTNTNLTQILFSTFLTKNYAEMSLISGGLYCWLGNGASTSNYNIVNAANLGISNDTWFHLTMVFDGSQSTDGTRLKVYKNGSLLTWSTVRTIPTTLGTSTNPTYIGSRNTATEFSGNIDEVAFWHSLPNVNDIYTGPNATDLSVLNPISWWRCGDGDVSPILTDNGSGGNDGTMTNFSTFSTDVPLFNTRSILLDGVDDYVDLGSGASLQITNTLSISAWVKTTDTNYIGIYGKGNSVAQADTYFRMQNTGVIRAFLNNNAINVTGTTAINDGNWHHVMFVYVPSTSMTIYVDGSQDAQNTTSIPSAINNNYSNVYIGQFQRWLGNIDEVAVWNSDQSANASTIYNSGVPNDISSLSPVSWWRCGDGDTAPTLTDNGSGGNDGTMTNFTTFSTDVPT